MKSFQSIPSPETLLVELVATLDSLILYSRSDDVKQQAIARRDELMRIKDTSPTSVEDQIKEFKKQNNNVEPTS